jgi:hypothetical protein
MDDFHFDALAKGLGTSGSRRRALVAVVGVTLAASLGHSEGTAKRTRRQRHGRRVRAEDDTLKPNGKKCNKDPQCLSGNCAGGTGRGGRGVCAAACTGFRQACTSADQCCAADQTTCGFNTAVTGLLCCRPLGKPCTSGGPNGDCCMVSVLGGSRDFAYCSTGGTCGGSGAFCGFNEACVSGQCSGGTCTAPAA